MKTHVPFGRALSRSLAALAVMAATMTASAAPPALQGQIDTRPLTPQEIKDYALAGAQGASGLNTVGVGQPAYLEAWVNSAIPASNIVSVTWTLTSKPITSEAMLSDSPLGPDVPPYKPSDRLVVRVAGRKLLLPDVAGQYTVTAEIVTDNGSGNATLTRTITAGTYLGAQTCALCHSGGVVAGNTYNGWMETAHADKLTREIDGHGSDHFGQNCISCHVVGYDTNTNAVNGGFDDLAKQLNWTFPALLTNGNWAAMPSELKTLGNIQCENCHGPGSEHAFALGNTNVSNWPRIGVTYSAGSCAQCHDSGDHHIKNAEWANSKHAITTTSPTGPTRGGCVGCHSGLGFADRMNGVSPLRTAYEAITCAACHDAHDATNPHQLRTVADITLLDGTQVTNGGNGALCMNCHMSRRAAVTYVENTTGSSQFGPHYSCQTDMLMGVNAITYGKAIPSSAHRNLEGSCTACHMQEIAAGQPGFKHMGGHTFSLRWDAGTPNDDSDDVHAVNACSSCHGQITSFNFSREDYDGDGVIEGVQTEVEGLLHELGMLLPPIGSPDVTIAASYTKQQLKAAFNYKFVEEDGSHGVHNVSYAVGILKASIADLTDDANRDGLADSWQKQYFGSISNPDASPNATPAGDGMPNWLKYSLGLNPMVAGMVLPDGVVWANEGATSGSTDTIQIYTAAEVVFGTEVGRTYQLQSISAMGAGWENVGGPINGTGDSMSFVTPTRNNSQQFYRVVHTP